MLIFRSFAARKLPLSWLVNRLRIVCNFGDSDSGAGEIHARATFRGVATRGKRSVHAHVFRGNPTPKLKTTRSLLLFYQRCKYGGVLLY